VTTQQRQDPWTARVRAKYDERLGHPVTVTDATEGFGPVTVRVPLEEWAASVAVARDDLGCAFFDFLTAVDELTDGFRIVVHVASRAPGAVEHLVVETLTPRDRPMVASCAEIYAGARWHERETHEMFGVDFTEGGEVLALDPLLLPDQFEGHPLRKEFVLASRVAKPWPGAKEPGESDHAPAAATPRRRIKPPGAPEPEQWGPREPGSEAPDPLAVAAPAPAARPRRAPRERPDA
jgi:NADH:ubiquinone oxidoreductase subunit C